MSYKQHILRSQESLKRISIDKKEITTKARYGPSKLTRIPFHLTEDLAFFVAAIIGDGHLKKDKLQISIELTNKKLLLYIKNICKKLFNREFNLGKEIVREEKKNSWNMCIDSKSIYLLLKEVFEIPPGKKSNIVKVPEYIKKSDKKIKIAFLKGIMATEGGKRKRGYGLSTASEELWEGLIQLFNDVNIPVLKDSWVYKKYKKKYYCLSFRKYNLNKIMWECRSGQTGDV